MKGPYSNEWLLERIENCRRYAREARDAGDEARAKSFEEAVEIGEQVISKRHERGVADGRRRRLLVISKPRNCLICKTQFVPRSPQHRYCSTQCKQIKRALSPVDR